MWILLLIMFPFSVGILFYFKAFFARMAACFGADITKRHVKASVWIAASAVGLFSLNPLRFGAIIVLHVLVISALFIPINLIAKKTAGKKQGKGYKAWKKIYDSGIVPIVLTLVLLITGFFNMHNVVRTDHIVYTNKDIGDGYRVVLIADVHYGVSIDEKTLTEKRDEISTLDADVVILCGDIVDSGTSKTEMQTVFEVFGKTKSKHGVFYVYGNHDRGYGHGGSFTNEELENAINKNGIRILKDEVYYTPNGLCLIGREDRGYSTGESTRKSIKELTEGIDEEGFIVALDHQPTEYNAVGGSSVDLLLSGHTHGGQLWPMNMIFELFNINDGVYGKIQIDEDTEAIVTSGFAGWSYPVKTAAPAEYVVIDIKN